MGVISAMVEKELGERNFGFDSLKSRLNRDMEKKGIVAVCGLWRNESPFWTILSASAVNNKIYFLDYKLLLHCGRYHSVVKLLESGNSDVTAKLLRIVVGTARHCLYRQDHLTNQKYNYYFLLPAISKKTEESVWTKEKWQLTPTKQF